MKVIIYKNDEGGVSIIHPAPNCPLTVEQIAAKDVPTGSPYAIVDKSEIPTDRTFRGAWDIDEAELTHGVGATDEEVQQMMNTLDGTMEA